MNLKTQITLIQSNDKYFSNIEEIFEFLEKNFNFRKEKLDIQTKNTLFINRDDLIISFIDLIGFEYLFKEKEGIKFLNELLVKVNVKEEALLILITANEFILLYLTESYLFWQIFTFNDWNNRLLYNCLIERKFVLINYIKTNFKSSITVDSIYKGISSIFSLPLAKNLSISNLMDIIDGIFNCKDSIEYEIKKQVFKLSDNQHLDLSNELIKNLPIKIDDFTFHTYQEIEIINDLDIFSLIHLNSLLILESEKKKQGAIFTPSYTAQFLTEYSLKHLTISSSQSNNPMKIIDPSFGSGIFFLYALNYLFTQFIRNKHTLSNKIRNGWQIYSLIFNDSIFGVESNSNTYEYCSRLFHKTFNIDYDILANNLLQNSFLDLSNTSVSETSGKYDLIIGNPPYISFSHSRQAKSIEKKLLQELNNYFADVNIIRPNSYIFFILRSLKDLLKDKGLVSFVIDRSFLTIPSYKNIREFLLNQSSIILIIEDLEIEVDAVVDLSAVVFSTRDRTSKVEYRSHINRDADYFSQKEFFSNPNTSYFISKNQNYNKNIQKISINLSDISEIKCGLEYGALLKSQFLSSRKTDETYYKVIDGSKGLFIPYLLVWFDNFPNSYVKFDKDFEKELITKHQNISPSKKEVKLISGNFERFRQNKIVLRQSADSLIACYDDEQFLCLRNLHVLNIVSSEYSPYFILAILNSSFATRYAKENLIIRKSGKRAYPQIRIKDLNRFPIVNLDLLSIEKRKSVKEITDLSIGVVKVNKEFTKIILELFTILNTRYNYKSQAQFLKSLNFKNGKITNKSNFSIPQSLMEKFQSLCLQNKEKRDKLDRMVMRIYSPNDEK